MIQAHTLEVKKKAHFYTSGKISNNTKYLWIVCHGYGQLASDFIEKFEVLGEEHFVVAPEGLSRFYWKGFSGRIAASWMTSKDRLDEIEDYSNMISTLYDTHREQLPDDVKIVLLGFSQGCATVIRWMMKRFPDFDTLIMYAGLFPEDLDYSQHLDYFNAKQIHFVYGDEDQFLNEAYIIAQKEFIETTGFKASYIPFKGKHEVVGDVLLEITD